MITGRYPNLRLRRNRKTDWARRLVAESSLSNNDLILPIFLIGGKNKVQTIKTMPGVFRYSIDKLSKIIDRAIFLKLPMVALFPYANSKLKNKFGSEALNEDNLICKAIRYIKKRYKNQIGIMCDVALDPYTSHGHDGLLKSSYVLNDETIEVLVKQSLLQAQMGCDVLAPSDMMDGRIGKIRKILDKNGYQLVQLLSYAVKYASSFYGPFRDAAGSFPIFGNRNTYQMDSSNINEAIKEAYLDIEEGADILMVKPALAYLDVIQRVKDEFHLPTAAFNVSGEYSLVKAAAEKGYIDEVAVVLELLTSIKRAGADIIITYHAKDVAKWLNGK